MKVYLLGYQDSMDESIRNTVAGQYGYQCRLPAVLSLRHIAAFPGEPNIGPKD